MRIGTKRLGWGSSLVTLTSVWAGTCIVQAAAEVTASWSRESHPAATITVPLQYREVRYSLMNLGVTVIHQPSGFKREPPIGKAKVRRGRLDFQFSKASPIPFLWDQARGKLHLDLNRNEDLTDDPGGLFASTTLEPRSSSYRHAMFTNVHLNFPTKAGQQPWLVDLNLSEYRGRPNAYAGVRSFWAGKAALAGREWQVGVIDNPQNRRGDMNQSHLLLRPWKTGTTVSAYSTVRWTPSRFRGSFSSKVSSTN